LKEEECGVWERIIKKLFPKWKFELHSTTQQTIVEKWIVFYTNNLSIKLGLVMYTTKEFLPNWTKNRIKKNVAYSIVPKLQ
jgi:hypothetical protein